MRCARTLAASLALLALVALAGSHPLRAGDGDTAFQALARSYFDEVFRASPTLATAVGVHDYDRELDRLAASDIAARIARDARYLERVTAVDAALLSPYVALDRTVLENKLRDNLLFDRTMETWRHNPDDYIQTIAGGLFKLISRDFASKRVRLQAAIVRLNAVPRLVAEAEANLTGVDRITAEISIDDAAGTAAFLQTSVPQALTGAATPAERAAFSRATAGAVHAVRAFGQHLRERFVAHPHGTFAIGPDNYRARLRYEEAIDLPLDAYLAIGRRALDETHAQMVATARRIEPKASVEQVLARVARRHPTAAELIPASNADLAKLRAFVVAKRIVTLPPNADISVTLTPEFERSTTVASMDAPGPLESRATKAYYNVTPVDPRDPPSVREAYLETFNDFERPIVSAHEVYPGHYTAFAVQRRLPLSLVAKLLGCTSFVEGWAHYGEQMVVDEGWGNGDPRVRLMQLKEAILRNARFVVGVGLHTSGMTVPQAERFFVEQAFLDRADARIEARRGTQDATYGYYTLGKLEILKLRADYRKKVGAAYTLGRFHDALISHGNPPIPLLRPLLLGDADDGQLLPRDSSRGAR
jgi:uncharacterized protein (DUF885 family)